MRHTEGHPSIASEGSGVRVPRAVCWGALVAWLGVALLLSPAPGFASQVTAEALAAARAHLQAGDVAAAITVLSRALTEHAEDRHLRLALATAHLHNADPAAAEAAVAPLAASSDAADRIDAAGVFLAAGRLARGVAILEGGSTDLRDSAALHAALGEAYLASRQPRAAEAALRRAIAVDASHAQAHHLLGRLLLDRAPAAGLDHLQRAVNLEPSRPAYLLDAGRALIETGRPDEAVGLFEIHAVVAPDDADGPLWLGRALIDAHRLPEAAEAFRVALARAPDNTRAHYHLGYIAWRMGDAKAAELAYARVLQLDVRDATTWHALGILRYQTDRPTEALDALDRALAIAPTLADAWFFRAKALQALDRSDEALASLQRALTVDPSLSKAWYQLATLHARRGDAELAQVAMQRFRETREQPR